MASDNGETTNTPLELSDILHVKTKDGVELPFEVVGILEDPDDGSSYAVLVHEPKNEEGEGEFIVTDLEGNLLEDQDLAQELLDDFLVFAEEANDDEHGDEA
jgi:uncharacterized protein YrzB (UPF0473 family)